MWESRDTLAELERIHPDERVRVVVEQGFVGDQGEQVARKIEKDLVRVDDDGFQLRCEHLDSQLQVEGRVVIRFSPCEKSEGRERRGREEGSCSANLFEFGVEYREVRKSGQLTRNQRGTVVSIVVVDFLSEDN